MASQQEPGPSTKDGQVSSTKDGQVSSTKDGQVSSTKDGQVSSTKDVQVSSTMDGQVSSTKDGKGSSTKDGESSSTDDSQSSSTKDSLCSSTKDGQSSSTKDGQSSSTKDSQRSTDGGFKFVPKSFRCLLIYPALLRAELAIQTRNGEEQKSIRGVLKFLTTCRDLSREDISRLIADFTESKHLVRALVLLHAEIAFRPPSCPYEAALCLEERTTKIFQVTQALIAEKSQRKRDIAVEYGIRKIEDMLLDFRQTKGVITSVRASAEVSCLNDLAHLYESLDEQKITRRYWKEALKLVEKKLKSNDLKNHFQGYLLHNIGLSFATEGELMKAESYFVQALDSYKHSSGSAAETKQRWYERCEASLKRVRDVLYPPESSRSKRTTTKKKR